MIPHAPTHCRRAHTPLLQVAHSHPARERATITAEFAILLPALMLLLILVFGVAQLGIAQLQVDQAARAAARLAARGEENTIGADVSSIAGPDASWALDINGGLVTVNVTKPVPGVLRTLAAGTVRSRVTTRAEPPTREGRP